MLDSPHGSRPGRGRLRTRAMGREAGERIVRWKCARKPSLVSAGHPGGLETLAESPAVRQACPASRWPGCGSPCGRSPSRIVATARYTPLPAAGHCKQPPTRNAVCAAALARAWASAVWRRQLRRFAPGIRFYSDLRMRSKLARTSSPTSCKELTTLPADSATASHPCRHAGTCLNRQ